MGRCMTRHELEADNIVLISIVERNIETLHSLVRVLGNIRPDSGIFYIPISEAMSKARHDIAQSRGFLDKLFYEGKFPQQ